MNLTYKELGGFLNKKLVAYSPNYKAQRIMAPFDLDERTVLRGQNANPRLGGVMVLFYEKIGDPHFVLIKRQEYEGVHSGQIALPGGKMEKGDASITHTALRETHEEIGVPESAIEVVGSLTQVYIPPSKFLVTPLVGFLNERVDFVPEEYEVSEIIEVPLAMLLDENTVKQGKVPVPGGSMRLHAPYFDIFGHQVWGATAIMLGELKSLFL